MSTEPGVLARNTSYFTLALVGQKVISFLYFTFLARLLGPENIGKYVFALSLTTIFSVLLDLGLAQVLTREVARDSTLAERYVRLTIGFKSLAGLVVVGLVALTVHILGYPPLTRQLVYLASIVMVIDSFTLTAYSTIRGFHTLTWESWGTILVQAVLALTGVAVAQFTHDLRAFMAALILAMAVNGSYSLWQLRFRFGVKLRPVIAWRGWQSLFRLSWPFALAAILTRVYSYTDSVLLSLLSGDRAVGIYSIAYKITFALQFIPTAFAASLFPGFSAYFAGDRSRLGEIFNRSVIYLTAIAVPVSFGIIALAPEIIRTIYPAYIEAIMPLQLLMISLPILFATFPVGSLLAGCNRQERNTLNLGVAAAVSVALNLLFIPWWGPSGAAIASLISTTALLVMGWVVVRQLIHYEARVLVSRLARVIMAGALMTLAVIGLKDYLHFTIVIPVAGLVYLGVLLWSKGVSWSEVVTLLRVVLKRKSGSI